MDTLRRCRAATAPLVPSALTLHILLLCAAVLRAGALAQEAVAGNTGSTKAAAEATPAEPDLEGRARSRRRGDEPARVSRDLG